MYRIDGVIVSMA